KKIAYSYWSGFSGLEDLPENYSTVVYEFEDVGNGSTNFTWTQIGYASEKSQQHSQEGLKAFIETIKEIAEQ
ncbi:MAG: SRPBCC family protein, partial [Saprospiraceae bacterium]